MTTRNRLIQSFIAFIALLATSPMLAQTTIVKAQLLDGQTNEPEPYATIRVFTPADKAKPVGVSVADAEGQVRQQVKGKGEFLLQVSALGKHTVEKPFSLAGEQESDLGVILLQDDAQLLAGVEVVGTKPLVKMEADKMTYSVENDNDSRTQTVLDMLRKVPMVTVDGQDNITVNGSSSFQVYVDGKPNPMLSQYASIAFKQMPASMVKSIEVVTNPGARYDAEGTGGILNIVMQSQNGQQQKINGISGQAQLMAAREGVGGGVSLTGQQGKWSYSGRLFGNHMELDGTTMSIDRLSVISPETSSVMNYNQKSRHIQNFMMGSIGAGVEIDTLSTLNASFSFMRSYNKDNGHPLTRTAYYASADGTGAPLMDYAYSQSSKQEQGWNNLQASIDYQRFFNSSHTRWISFIYQFGYSPTLSRHLSAFDEQYDLPVDLTSRKSKVNNRTADHTFQADYQTPIGQHHTLSAGLKYALRHSRANSAYFLDEGSGTLVYTPDLSMKYIFDNHVAAAYAEDDIKLGKLQLKPGLRYEYTWQNVEYRLGNGTDFKKRYGNLVPTATVSYAFAPVVNLGLSYNMRISRPSISYLNPYIERSNPTQLTYGDTNIDVEKTHTVRLTFNAYLGKLMLTTNLQHRFGNNGISQYSFLEGEILHNTYGNTVKSRQTSYGWFASWSASKSTRLLLNGETGYTHLESRISERRNHGWYINSMIGLQQKLPAKFNFNLYLFNRTKQYILPGWTSGFNMVNATVNRSLLNDRLTVGISGVSGLGHGGKFCFDTKTMGRNYRQMQRARIPVHTIMLQINFNFGSLKQTTSRSTKSVDNDYKEQNSGQINMMGGMEMDH